MLAELCSIGACTKPARCRTWCESHYRRFLRSGDPLKPGTRSYHDGVCSFSSCGRPIRSGGLCKQHYDQRRNDAELRPLRTTPQKLYIDVNSRKRECGMCNEIKSFDEFVIAKDGPGGRHSFCILCNRAYQQQRYRGYYLKYHYNIDGDKFLAMLAKQEGRCGLCGCAQGDWMWNVDHDHSCCPGKRSCGKCVRALLCPTCNTRLGILEDITWVRMATMYIDKFAMAGGETLA